MLLLLEHFYMWMCNYSDFSVVASCFITHWHLLLFLTLLVHFHINFQPIPLYGLSGWNENSWLFFPTVDICAGCLRKYAWHSCWGSWFLAVTQRQLVPMILCKVDHLEDVIFSREQLRKQDVFLPANFMYFHKEWLYRTRLKHLNVNWIAAGSRLSRCNHGYFSFLHLFQAFFSLKLS